MKNFKNFKIIALAFVLSVSISQPTSAIKQIEKVSIEGKKRYETAIQISKKSYPKTSDTVIIVNSEKIADSLSVGVLAHKINSPILLTDHDEINQSTLKEIQRLKTTNIILVGGTQSISKSQETNLINQGYKVRRIYGKDRIDTSFSIATELSNLNQTKQFDNAFVVHATKSIVDSASVSAAACSMNSPILFVGNDTKSFEEKYSNYTFNNTYLIGGATAKLSKNFPNSKIIYGKNRNDTSMIIADTFFKDTKSVFLAKNGEQRFSELIDCVTVAPFAANEKSPIIFASTKNNLTQSEKNFFDKLNPNKITLVGGGLHPKFDEIIGKTPPKKEYVLLNVSQINQNKAGLPMGCEAASLLQCLHYKNIKTNTNIHQFIKEMPLAKDNNPNHGFAGSPFNIDERIYQSIFPEPLTKWANKYATAENISGKSSEYIREEIAKGNPVIFFGTYKFRNPTFKDYFWGKNALYNAHVMVVDGYDKNRMHIVDPAEDKPSGYWISRSLFDKRYNIKKYAVVVR